MKNLEKIFNPKTVALIGATARHGSVGFGILNNLMQGNKKRKIFPVNPYEKKVLGEDCFSSVKSIKEDIDLAVIAVPAKVVPEVVKESIEKKVGGIIIISAGFAEDGEEGKALQKEVMEMIAESDIPLVGPNCLGILRPSLNLNASFAPITPKKGGVAFLSQSGALIDSVIDGNSIVNYGFSTIVSYGNEADLDVSDFLDYLKNDSETKVVAIYLEGLRDGRKFMKVAKDVSKLKPVLILKAGKTESGKKAALSHTASLAGSHQIYSAAFKQAGVTEVESLEELFDLAKALSWQPRCKNGIAVITNGGGAGVLATDYFEQYGIKMPKLSAATISRLKESKIMNAAFVPSNPLDIIGDALSDRYELAISSLLDQKDISGLLVIQTLQIMTDPEKNAKIIIEAKKKWKGKPMVAAFLGGALTMSAIELLEGNDIPNYSDLKRAASAIKSLIIK
jgi:acetyltransferase